MFINKKLVFIAFILSCFIFQARGQLVPNSPYTRYGFGNLQDIGGGQNIALGGMGIGLSEGNSINYLNPASYHYSIDTLNFVFDVNIRGQLHQLSSDFGKSQGQTITPDYFILGFPITKWLKSTIGIIPYSSINYKINNTLILPEETVTTSIYGKGGINEIYLGFSVAPIQNLTLGVNSGYRFGEYYRNREVFFVDDYYYEPSFIYNYMLKGYSLNLGAQYKVPLKEKINLIFGLRYDPPTKLKIKQDYSILQYSFIADTISNETVNYKINVPQRIGAGVSFVYDQKLISGFDFIYQNWDKNSISNADTLGVYYSLRYGLEYTPVTLAEIRKVGYIKRMTFRAGVYFTQSYYEFNGTAIKDMGFTIGLGFPIKDFRKLFSKSAFNLSYRYGVMGTENNGLVSDVHHTLMLGITLHDIWFVKPKYH